jgi:DNA invertase Pin-like site-specific DNA recombinase
MGTHARKKGSEALKKINAKTSQITQHEREMISERTKATLAAAKRRGKRLGK